MCHDKKIFYIKNYDFSCHCLSKMYIFDLWMNNEYVYM